MKIVRKDKSLTKENINVQRSVNIAVRRLNERLSQYVDVQHMDVGKIFNDDILMHDILNGTYYIYKCACNQMQIRILWTVEDNKLVIISYWYKNRTNNEYIRYFADLISKYVS